MPTSLTSTVLEYCIVFCLTRNLIIIYSNYEIEHGEVFLFPLILHTKYQINEMIGFLANFVHM